MEKVVSVLRNHRTGAIVLYPMGTFRGFGGYVGINPYSELPVDCTSEKIGQTVIDLLVHSGATGFYIKEIEKYREENFDDESQRVRDKFFSKVHSTSSFNQDFICIEVSMPRRQQSWDIVKFRYDDKQSLMAPDVKYRVKMSEGAVSLGQILLDLLQAELPR
jgi:hypothetical protein